jgi:hypothetical protein
VRRGYPFKPAEMVSDRPARSEGRRPPVKQEPWPARAENPRPSGRGEVNVNIRQAPPGVWHECGTVLTGGAPRERAVLSEMCSMM